MILGGLGALIVLVLVFGSLMAGVPLVVAAVSILGTYLALLGLTLVTDVSFVVQYLVALIGLGVAIDYSLLLVTRWREERAGGANDDEAVLLAMGTAGRSVLFSGVTVAVSLAALVLVPLPFLRSIGLGGLLIPLFSVATTLTLVPVILSALGSRLLWPRRNSPLARNRVWTGAAQTVLAHRWLTIVGTTTVLIALAAPVLTLRLGSPQLSGLESRAAASRVTTGPSRRRSRGRRCGPTEVLVARRRRRTRSSTGCGRRRVVGAVGADRGLALRRLDCCCRSSRRRSGQRCRSAPPSSGPRVATSVERRRQPGRGRRLHQRGLRQRHLGRCSASCS